MAASANDVVSGARVLLKDSPADQNDRRYSDANLLSWVQDAIATVLVFRPEAATKMVNLKLCAGSKQTLPLDVRLIDVRHNVDGPPINRVDEYALDSAQPGWQQQKEASTIFEYTYRDTAPRVFYVNPPALEGLRVVAELAITPKITSLSDMIVVPDSYVPALINFVLYRAYSLDADHAAMMNIAAGQLASFAQFLGIDIDTVKRVNPRDTHDQK